MQGRIIASDLGHFVNSQEREAESQLELGQVDGDEAHQDGGFGCVPVSYLDRRLSLNKDRND